MDNARIAEEILEATPDALWVFDLEGRTVYGNTRLARLYGGERPRLPERVQHTLDEVGRRQFAAHLEQLARGETNDGEVEVQFLTAGGDVVWLLVRETLLPDPAGGATRVLHRCAEYTDRRSLRFELEEQVAQNLLMQQVATYANDGESLGEVLAQARHVVVDHGTWHRARAWLPGEQAPLPLFADADDAVEHAADPARAAVEERVVTAVTERHRPVWSDDFRTLGFPVADGEDVRVVVTLSSDTPPEPRRLHEELATHVGTQLSRVAERERSRHQLATARDLAMEASRQKSDFLATMSHEIRTPLNGVIGLTDLLLRTRLDAEQQRLASGVQVASRALLGIINDILDFSKIEAGRLELESIDFELRAMLDHVAEMLGQQARDKGLELVLSCAANVPSVVAGDPTRLTQVITNFVSNAVKFTETGVVAVRVSLEPDEATGELPDAPHDLPGGTPLTVRLEVSDTGIGVPADRVAGLFEPFTQADASTTRRFGGTGLGLAICHEIVAAMNGRVGYRPREEGGSVFWCTAQLHAPRGEHPDPADEKARAMLEGTRALVVDDTGHNRLVLVEQLQWWGVQADEATDVDSALALVAQAREEGRPYQIALLDLAMPLRDGLELASELRRDTANDEMMLMMLTSLSELDPAQVRAAGLDDCLVKPVVYSVLRTALMDLLAGSPAVDAPRAAPTSVRSGRRILVVEDNPINQMVALGLLESLGYRADTVDDGLAAVEAVLDGDYDAVLMDVQMPRLDGYGATREIRSRQGGGRRVPIIAMTAAAIEGERERCLEAGMDDFITKPVDPAILATALQLWAHPGDGTGVGTGVGLGGTAAGATAPPPAPASAVGPASTPAGTPASTPAGIRPQVGSGQAAAPAWDDEEPEGGPPTAATPELEGLDLDRLDMLRDLDPGNTAYLDRAISNFLNNSDAGLAEMLTAIQSGDAAALRQSAHKLAGGALNLGIGFAGESIRVLERIADRGTVEGAADAFPAAVEAVERGRGALAAYQRTYRGD